jgi:hypothetical protein
VLKQFGGLNAERNREILWRMELFPIPVGRKLAQFISQLYQVVGLGQRF